MSHRGAVYRGDDVGVEPLAEILAGMPQWAAALSDDVAH